MKESILEIAELETIIDNKKILQGLNLKISPNEIHVIMGPNGSGKSTFSKILAGHPSYQVKKGTLLFQGKDLLTMPPEIRSHEGLFLAFQYPLEIPGLSTYDFLRIAFNEKQKYFQLPELDPISFMTFLSDYLEKLKIPKEFLSRNLNEGFSGGEKKRTEILQMLLLKPKLIILDEIDSGLDIDAIKLIYQSILTLKEKDSSILLITHYPQILDYIKPDYTHVIINGKIVESDRENLIEKIVKNGYDSFLEKEKNI